MANKKILSLGYLEKQLRHAEASLEHARQRGNNQEERANLAMKIELLQWIIDRILNEETSEWEE